MVSDQIRSECFSLQHRTKISQIRWSSDQIRMFLATRWTKNSSDQMVIRPDQSVPRYTLNIKCSVLHTELATHQTCYARDSLYMHRKRVWQTRRCTIHHSQASVFQKTAMQVCFKKQPCKCVSITTMQVCFKKQPCKCVLENNHASVFQKITMQVCFKKQPCKCVSITAMQVYFHDSHASVCVPVASPTYTHASTHMHAHTRIQTCTHKCSHAHAQMLACTRT